MLDRDLPHGRRAHGYLDKDKNLVVPLILGNYPVQNFDSGKSYRIFDVSVHSDDPTVVVSGGYLVNLTTGAMLRVGDSGAFPLALMYGGTLLWGRTDAGASAGGTVVNKSHFYSYPTETGLTTELAGIGNFRVGQVAPVKQVDQRCRVRGCHSRHPADFSRRVGRAPG